MSFDLKTKLKENDFYSDLTWNDKQYIEHISEEDIKFFDRILDKLITSLKISNFGSKEIGVPPMDTLNHEIERQIEIYFKKSNRVDELTTKLKSQIVNELFREFCSKVVEIKRIKENPTQLELLNKSSKKLKLFIITSVIVCFTPFYLIGLPFLILFLIRRLKIEGQIDELEKEKLNLNELQFLILKNEKLKSFIFTSIIFSLTPVFFIGLPFLIFFLIRKSKIKKQIRQIEDK